MLFLYMIMDRVKYVSRHVDLDVELVLCFMDTFIQLKHLLLQLYVDTLVKKAYDNWSQVIEYDGKSLLSFKQSKKSTASRSEVQIGQLSYPDALDHQIQVPRLPPTVPNEQPSVQVGGKYYWMIFCEASLYALNGSLIVHHFLCRLFCFSQVIMITW